MNILHTKEALHCSMAAVALFAGGLATEASLHFSHKEVAYLPIEPAVEEDEGHSYSPREPKIKPRR